MAQKELIIFDFDGVLVDTEYATFTYYKERMPQYGFELKDEDFKLKQGRKSVDFFKDVMGDEFDATLVDTLIQEKRKAFLINIEDYVTPLPGAFELVKECHSRGLILAVGSQNERPMIDAVLKKFNVTEYFTTTTALQDLTNKKPDPEIFLLVAERVGIDPAQGVVIEDHVEGVQAAKGGGFTTVGVTTATSKEELEAAGADHVVSSPAELSADILVNLQ